MVRLLACVALHADDWGGPAPPAVSYRYSPDRKGEHARALLAGCRCFLHADGYAGFNGLYEPDASGTAPLVVHIQSPSW